MSQQILSTKTHRAGSFSWIFRTPFSGSCCWKRNQSLETLLSNYYLMHLGHIYDKLTLLKKNIANKNWYIFLCLFVHVQLQVRPLRCAYISRKSAACRYHGLGINQHHLRSSVSEQQRARNHNTKVYIWFTRMIMK